MVKRFFSGQNLLPLYFLLSLVGFFYGSIENSYRSTPDIGPGAIAFDEWDNGLIRNLEDSIADGDFVSAHGMIDG
jgi:hypothetical protein